MTKLFRLVAPAVAASFLLACACSKDAKKAGTPGGAAVGGAAPTTVVASYAGKKLTLGELDERIELDKQVFQMRKRALEGLIIEDLVKAAAEKKGQTEQQWFKEMVEDKVGTPTQQEIEAAFNQNAARMPGAKLEDFKDRISSYLTETKKQEMTRQLLDSMKKEANVEISLAEPPLKRKQVEVKGPSRGPETAKVTIVEFSDFQCPFCSKAHDTIEEVMQAYAGKVRLVFRHFPLEFHKEAPKAAEASACANEQGKFWEYHDVLFKNQQKLQVPQLKEHAGAVGLDAAKFADCLDSGRHAQLVKDDMAAGQKVGVTGTPAFFINGLMLSGALPLDEFKKVIDQELGTN